MFDRAILHMDLDAFFVSVECLKNPELLGQPIIIGGNGPRGVVSSCSYEARKYGVHSAMPVGKAMCLCPKARVIRGDVRSYSKYSRLVTEIIADSAPLYEKASIDEFYLDLSGMDKYFSCFKWSTELRTKIKSETGLPISMGLSVNKLVSKIACGEAKPNGALMISRGGECVFLQTLSIKKIPGVGEKTFQKLKAMGINTIKGLRELSKPMLYDVFGRHGLSLWKKARAQDDSPVRPHREQKSMSKERTFSRDTTEVKNVVTLIHSLCEELAFKLRKKAKLCGCVTVKIRYSDFKTLSRQKSIPYHSLDKTICRVAIELFESLYNHKEPIRLVGVRLSNLISGSQQIRLFEDTVDEISLMKAMDNIKNKYGKSAVKRASGIV